MTIWRRQVGDIFYDIEVDDHLIKFNRHEGTPESYGGKSIFAKYFLNDREWQAHVESVFGKDVLGEVLKAAEIATLIERPESTTFDLHSTCPFCGKPLRTSKAKQCPHCFKDWRQTDA